MDARDLANDPELLSALDVVVEAVESDAWGKPFAEASRVFWRLFKAQAFARGLAGTGPLHLLRHLQQELLLRHLQQELLDGGDADRANAIGVMLDAIEFARRQQQAVLLH